MKNFIDTTPFASITEASRATGLSQHYLRTGCKNGEVPHVMVGNKYMIRVDLLLQQLTGQTGTDGEGV